MTDELRAYNPSAALGAARDFFWGDLCDWYLEIVKPRFKDPASAPAARSVLAYALDQVLRLFQPFVPFITEALWELLGAQCPVRGLEAPLPGSRLLLNAAWPAARPERRDAGLEDDFALAKAVVKGIREVRALHSLPPSRKLDALIKADGTSAEILGRMRHFVSNLGALSSLRIGPDVARPATAVAQVVEDMELYLEGVIDPEKERERLLGRRKKLIEDAQKAEAKLSNEGFVGRAPADVVDKERQKLKDLLAQVEMIDANLKAL